MLKRDREGEKKEKEKGEGVTSGDEEGSIGGKKACSLRLLRGVASSRELSVRFRFWGIFPVSAAFFSLFLVFFFAKVKRSCVLT